MRRDLGVTTMTYVPPPQLPTRPHKYLLVHTHLYFLLEVRGADRSMNHCSLYHKELLLLLLRWREIAHEFYNTARINLARPAQTKVGPFFISLISCSCTKQLQLHSITWMLLFVIRTFTLKATVPVCTTRTDLMDKVQTKSEAISGTAVQDRGRESEAQPQKPTASTSAIYDRKLGLVQLSKTVWLINAASVLLVVLYKYSLMDLTRR